MCNYCEYNLSFDFDFDEDDNLASIVNFSASICGSSWRPIMKLNTSIDLNIHGSLNFENSFHINYCPICGRKLSE